MKNLKSLIWVLPFALGLSACNSDEETAPQQVNIQVSTGNVQETSLTTATMQGSISGSASSYTEVGMVFYPENNSGAINYAKSTNVEYGSGNNRNFSVTLSGLSPNAAYIYYAYVKDVNGKLTYAKEQKVVRTKSPADLLTLTSMHYVALRDASLYWYITDNKIFSELVEKKVNASFGVAWASEKYLLNQVGYQSSANQQTVVFDNTQKAIVRFISLNPSSTYYYTTYVNLNGQLYVAPVTSFVTTSEDVFTGSAPSSVQLVNMGLPSGTQWANMNVGAETVEDAGQYFAWGETVGYKPTIKTNDSDALKFSRTFDWSNYRWCRGSRESQTKYCTNSNYGIVDNKTFLDLTDDAAFINWGDNWRMPTADEMKELFDNTVCEWMILDGVDGYRFTSKINGKSLFLPAAGCGVSETHYDEGLIGYYWSSSIDQPSPYASRYLGFKGDRDYMASMHRYYGMCIRPVRRD